MVFFTCNACGEALKKNKVDKHLFQCRTKSLSCIDCNKDFFGNDYNSHNECISEDQKYGGIDFKAKDSSQKGKLKQENWIQKIKDTINESNVNKNINDLMQRLLDFDNIPRKEKKFLNFVKNSLKVRNDVYINQMWSIFESATKHESNNVSKQTESSINGNKRQLNQTEMDDSIPFKKSKESHNESQPLNEEKFDESIQNSTLDSKQKLKMNKILVEILKNIENNEISIKKLRKKVIKVYKSNDKDYCKEKVVEKFDQKINNHKKLIINEGKVALIKK